MFFKGDAPLSVTVSSECTILHYHQQRVLISPSCHHLLSCVFRYSCFYVWEVILHRAFDWYFSVPHCVFDLCLSNS